PVPGAPSAPKPYVLTTNLTFTWPAVVDPEGGISGYHVLVGNSLGGSNVFNGIVSGVNLTVTSSFGTVLYAAVSALNNAGIEGGLSASSPGILVLNPSTIVLVVGPPTGAISLTWPANLSSAATLYSATNLSPPVT